MVSKRINCQMNFVTFAFLGAVIPRTPTTFRRGLQGTTVEDRCGWFFLATFSNAQDGAQIVDQRFKDFGFEPAARLLINDIPGWQIMRQPAPLCPSPHDPAQAIKDFAQGIIALGRLFTHQRQVRSDERPFFVAHIAGISFAFHLNNLSQLKVNNRL